VLSSPTCPGYLEALAKLTPPPPEPSLTTQPSDAGTITLVDSVLISPTGTYGTMPPPGSPPPPDGSQPTPAGSPTLGSAPNPIQQSASSQPSATSPQTKIGEVVDSGGGSKSTVSLSSVLSMISSNQEKTAALEKSVVQAADAQAFSAGETAKATAEKIAGDAQSQSIATSNSQATSAVQIGATQSFSSPMQSTAVAIQGNLQSNTVLNTARQEQANTSTTAGQQATTANTQQQSSVSSLRQDGVNIGQFSLQTPRYEPPKFESSYTPPTTSSIQYQPPARQEFSIAMVSPAVSYSLVPASRYTPQIQLESTTLEPIRFGHKSPVETAMEARPFLPEINTGAQTGSSVKKNVQNNDLAGNVTVESIAKQPANYAQYFAMMPDNAFYAPKEIYRNQRTVDNARVMRGLTGGSDAKHQQMVDQQYKERK
jgi:hypothetical protein